MMLLVLLLGFAISLLSGFLGIGGGILLAPALLYLPPLFGLGALDMRQVTGLTITQGLFACLSGAVRHDRHHCVHRRLVVWMGAAIASSALAGSVLSRWVANEVLMALFAALAVVAALLMCFLREDDEQVALDLNLPLAVSIALAVGLLCGMVGQGGSFLLIPLMLFALRLPTRVVIGSNLALVFLSSLAGFAGKLATGQIPYVLALLLVAGAVPGAQLGSIASQRTSPRWLRATLALIVIVAACGIAAEVLLARK